MRHQLWSAYAQARAAELKAEQNLLGKLSALEWDLVWRIQSDKYHIRPDQTLRLEKLYRHMSDLGKATTERQRAEYLECLFLNGKEQEALKEWEDDHASRGRPEQVSTGRDHLSIGAKLHALAGNVDRSHEAMHLLFKHHPDHNNSIMLAVLVFRGHTSSMDEQHHHHANEIYLRIKETKGSCMTLDDYDAFFVGFLEAKHLRYAQQVFRDMVQDGVLDCTGTVESVHEVLKRLHKLYRLGTDITKMTSIALGAIEVLPPAYHGHLFGDWMKSTVVTNAPKAGAEILSLMSKRGWPPETIHFNMFLKAMLRTKEDANVLKAENIAWHMIEEAGRVQTRSLPHDSRAEQIYKLSQTTRPHVEPTRGLARADVTTFALMMHHHARKHQWEHVDYLARQLGETDIIPNTTIMNVLIDNKCRQGAYTEAFSTYRQLTNPGKGKEAVFPNGSTMRCLWKTLRLALGDHATRDLPGLPTPRQLMYWTYMWWTLCRSRYDADRFKMGLAGANGGALSKLVMHCFSYKQDLAGLLVALHLLRQKFDIFPNNNAVTILQRQMAWVDTASETQSSRRRYFHSRANQRNTERIVRVYNILLNKRKEEIGDEWKNWTDVQIKDFGLDLLSEFVRVVVKRSCPDDLVELKIEVACVNMGVDGMQTGSKKAWEVL